MTACDDRELRLASRQLNELGGIGTDALHREAAFAINDHEVEAAR